MSTSQGLARPKVGSGKGKRYETLSLPHKDKDIIFQRPLSKIYQAYK